MSSRLPENNRARSIKRLLSQEGRQEFVISLLPIAELREARDDVIDIFACAYEEVNDISAGFEEIEEMSRPDKRDWAIEPCPQITEYDPHKSVMRVLRLARQLKRNIKRMLWILMGIASAFQFHSLGKLAMGGIENVGASQAIIPFSILGVIAILVWLLVADTFAYRVLARNLRVGKKRVMMRDDSEIVGCGIWNRSLLGQAGLLLVGIFFILRSLGELPLFPRVFDHPDRYVKSLVAENMDIFVDASGLVEITGGLCQRNQKSV